MEKTILISLPIEDLQTVIIDCVNSCLKHNKQNNEPQKPDFKLLPIQVIFKSKIISKATLYKHVKAGKFSIHKIGNKSFYDPIEFERAFHKVKLGN